MRFANIVLTALPILAAAGASLNLRSDGYPDIVDDLGTGVQQDGGTIVPGDSDQESHESPARDLPSLGKRGYVSIATDVYDQHSNDTYDYPVPRALEARDDKDHFVEECNSDAQEKKCIFNKIVPKGKGKGVCTNRIQKESWLGTIHIMDPNIMCKYYRDADCKGFSMGPYSNQDCEYSWCTTYYGQIVENPQSFFCQNIGFQPPNVPVKPPGPQPRLAPLGYAPTLDWCLSHSSKYGPEEEPDSQGDSA